MQTKLLVVQLLRLLSEVQMGSGKHRGEDSAGWHPFIPPQIERDFKISVGIGEDSSLFGLVSLCLSRFKMEWVTMK